MALFLKTVFIFFFFLIQLSSSAIIKRHDWPPYCPWWRWGCGWPPVPHSQVHSTATTTMAHTASTIFSTTSSVVAHTVSTSWHTAQTSASPTSPTLKSKSDTATFSSTVETGAPSSSKSSTHITTSTLPHVTSSSSSVYISSPTTKTKSTITVAPTTSTQSTVPPPTSTTTKSSSWWKPAAGVKWQIQISGTVDTSVAADVYDVDLFDTPASTIATLHSQNRKVICYFSAGTYENWRPDQSSFQASDKGSAMADWPGEWWLNTNSANVRSIMTTRIQLAVSKGCDGIDPDNVDGYDNSNGLGLTQSDAVNYLTFLSTNAHSNGLAIGLKNAGGLINTILPSMEWAVNEQCEQYGECNLSDPFIQAGKPVFHIEYPDGAPNISPSVKQATCGGGSSTSGFSTVLKTMDLTAWVDAC